MAVRAIMWADGWVRLLDQTRLPLEVTYLELHRWEEVVAAIKEMRIRGAPAIGIAGAYAMALAASEERGLARDARIKRLADVAQSISNARPTAINLKWAVERCLAVARSASSGSEVAGMVIKEAVCIHKEDESACRRIGQLGAELVPFGSTLLTHCNTGSLATGGDGTALAVVREAWRQGRLKGVVATETRPRLQGAKLTAWELMQDGLPTTLVVDSAAGYLMKERLITAVVVGADRIARNGDVANKIGTYSLAVLAKENGLPFYVAAPTSTVDPKTASGNDIAIERRSTEEVARFGEAQIVLEGVKIDNPAFDVTPARYITAIITENVVARRPYRSSLRESNGG